MLNINSLPDYEYRKNETSAERRERSMNAMRASSQSMQVLYTTQEDRIGDRRETSTRTRTEYVKLYPGAIVAVERDEGSFWGRRIESFTVQGLEGLPLEMEQFETNVNSINGPTKIKVYKLVSLQPVAPTMGRTHTTVQHETTPFGTHTRTVHVEETYTPHRPTVTQSAPKQEVPLEAAAGQLIGALLGLALTARRR